MSTVITNVATSRPRRSLLKGTVKNNGGLDNIKPLGKMQGGVRLPGQRAPPVPKRKRRTPRRAAPKGGLQPIHRAHTEHACAALNPFCSKARGYRIPDGLAANTFAVQGRGHLGLTVTATGDALAVLQPTAPYGVVTGTSVAASLWTIPGTFTPYGGLQMLSNNGTNYRIVSFGAIIRVMSNTTNSQGLLYINTAAPGQAYLGSASYPQVSVDYVEQKAFPINAGAEYCWVSKPLGFGAPQFIAQSVNNTNNTVNWTTLVVEINGGVASTTKVDIEYYLNVEFEVANANSLVHVAPPTAQKNQIALNARDHAHSVLDSAFAGGIQAAENYFWPVVSNFVQTSLGSMIEDVGPALLALTL